MKFALLVALAMLCLNSTAAKPGKGSKGDGKCHMSPEDVAELIAKLEPCLEEIDELTEEIVDEYYDQYSEEEQEDDYAGSDDEYSKGWDKQEWGNWGKDWLAEKDDAYDDYKGSDKSDDDYGK